VVVGGVGDGLGGASVVVVAAGVVVEIRGAAVSEVPGPQAVRTAAASPATSALAMRVRFMARTLCTACARPYPNEPTYGACSRRP
jgi:hypothetical protein